MFKNVTLTAQHAISTHVPVAPRARQQVQCPAMGWNSILPLQTAQRV